MGRLENLSYIGIGEKDKCGRDQKVKGTILELFLVIFAFWSSFFHMLMPTGESQTVSTG
jgi:hypothetical protein